MSRCYFSVLLSNMLTGCRDSIWNTLTVLRDLINVPVLHLWNIFSNNHVSQNLSSIVTSHCHTADNMPMAASLMISGIDSQSLFYSLFYSVMSCARHSVAVSRTRCRVLHSHRGQVGLGIIAMTGKICFLWPPSTGKPELIITFRTVLQCCNLLADVFNCATLPLFFKYQHVDIVVYFSQKFVFRKDPNNFNILGNLQWTAWE